VGVLYGLWLLLLGCLAVPHLYISKKLVGRLTRFQGWIGFVSALVGLYEITWLLASLAYLGQGVSGVVRFLVVLVAVICQIVLGFILGIGIAEHFVRDAEAQAKMEQLLGRVLPYQTTLGLLAIADGIAVVIAAVA
jgi:hypothetical protein